MACWVNTPERFRNKLRQNGECWEFPGKPDSSGYCRIYVDSVRWLVHRYAYTVWVGPIPEGLVIDHTCDNPICCNPGHLKAVTQQANVLRALRRSHCKRGHEMTSANTYTRMKEGTERHECRTCRNTAASRR